ncbi:MAG: heavy-metal-associated domain-containing protein [Cellulosilyticaceae bacterium]
MKKKIMIDGMSCMNCVKHVREALEELGKVEVNLEGKYALVETEESDEQLIEAIDEAGYDVVSIEIL